VEKLLAVGGGLGMDTRQGGEKYYRTSLTTPKCIRAGENLLESREGGKFDGQKPETRTSQIFADAVVV